LAYTISRVENDFNSGRSPVETRLQHHIPGRKAHHTGLKTQWDQVFDEASKKLAHLFLDKLADDYTHIKRRIEEKFGAMKDTLEPNQFEEIRDSLTTKYKKAATKPPGEYNRSTERTQPNFNHKSTAVNNTCNQLDNDIKDQTEDNPNLEGKHPLEGIQQ
jgi:hypothetical protein